MGDVRFNATEAEQLIYRMLDYCQNVGRETTDIKDILENSDEWDDNQRKAFDNNMDELVNDLKKAISIEYEYMEMFRQRVQELRG